MNGAIRRDLHQSVLSRLDARKTGLPFAEDIDRCRNYAEEILQTEMSRMGLGRTEEQDLRQGILDEIFWYGPITPLLSDPSVSEIMVNGSGSIYVERAGKLALQDSMFLSEESLRATIDRMVSRVNRRLDESSPYVDARLPDGSRINAIIPPVCLTGACLTIRKFRREAFSLEELVRIGSLTQGSSEYLREAVRHRRNIVVSGGTGSGKTTLLNALSLHIPEEERIITIEDAAEIRLQKPHVIRLEARPPNLEGSGAVTIRDLVRNSLRMRPDRIIVGECRGAEALDMLQAMNTGHDGSITTGHANTPRDMLRRLETMVLFSGVDIPVRAIREQIASAVDLIVHTGRIPGGKRAVTSITEVTGMNDSQILIQEIFRWAKGDDGTRPGGHLVPTNIPSRFLPEEERPWG
jgi:pilus assembly protein CpaF